MMEDTTNINEFVEIQDDVEHACDGEMNEDDSDAEILPPEEDAKSEDAPEGIAESDPPCTFAIFYNTKNVREVIAAVVLRNTYNCDIISLMPDLVVGIQNPALDEFVLLGPHWNKKIDNTLKLFPNTKVTIFANSEFCRPPREDPRINFHVGGDVCAWVCSEFAVEIPEKVLNGWNDNITNGLNYSYVNESLPERIARILSSAETLAQVESVGELANEMRIAVARERIRNFGGVIIARNGHKFATCHALEFNSEMHEELAAAFPEADGTLLVSRSFRFDVTTYELASKKINVMEQLSHLATFGTHEIARADVFGNHSFPPF